MYVCIMLDSDPMNFSPWVSESCIDITLVLQQEAQNVFMPVRISPRIESGVLLQTPQGWIGMNWGSYAKKFPWNEKCSVLGASIFLWWIWILMYGSTLNINTWDVSSTRITNSPSTHIDPGSPVVIQNTSSYRKSPFCMGKSTIIGYSQ